MRLNSTDFYDTERFGVVHHGLGYDVIDKLMDEYVFSTRTRAKAHAEARKRNRSWEKSKLRRACPVCGYTEEDARLHMDHNKCPNHGNAPWEQHK